MPNDFMIELNAFAIAKTYGMFPDTPAKFEMTRNASADDYGFFATVDNSIKIDILFEELELER